MEWAVYRTIPFDVYVLKQLGILHDFLGNFCNLDWLMTVVFFLTRGYARAYHELLQGQEYANESLAHS